MKNSLSKRTFLKQTNPRYLGIYINITTIINIFRCSDILMSSYVNSSTRRMIINFTDIKILDPCYVAIYNKIHTIIARIDERIKRRSWFIIVMPQSVRSV